MEAGLTMESSLGVRVRERIPDPEAAAQAGRGWLESRRQTAYSPGWRRKERDIRG